MLEKDIETIKLLIDSKEEHPRENKILIVEAGDRMAYWLEINTVKPVNRQEGKTYEIRILMPPQIKGELIYQESHLYEDQLRKGIKLCENSLNKEKQYLLKGNIQKSHKEHFKVEVQIWQQEQGDKEVKTCIREYILYFKYIEVYMAMSIYQEKIEKLGQEVTLYKLCAKNMGSVLLTQAVLYIEGQSIKLLGKNDEIKSMLHTTSPIEEQINLGDIAPHQDIEVEWEVEELEDRKDEEPLNHVRITYYYDKQGILRQGTKGIGLSLYTSSIKVKKEISQDNLCIKQYDKQEKVSNSIKLQHEGRIETYKGCPTIYFTLEIYNTVNNKFEHLICLYHLDYKLMIIGGTLRLNHRMVRGDIRKLLLSQGTAHSIGEEPIKITFLAKVKEEYKRIRPIGIQCGMKVMSEQKDTRLIRGKKTFKLIIT